MTKVLSNWNIEGQNYQKTFVKITTVKRKSLIGKIDTNFEKFKTNKSCKWTFVKKKTTKKGTRKKI